MQKTFHCWYSEKMRNTQDMMGKNTVLYKLSNGKEVAVTLATQDKEHGTKWDDITYLGVGEFSRIIPQ